MRSRGLLVLLFCATVLLYCLTNYGGIRSPDGEVMFRVSERLASSGTFALEGQLEDWKGFGLRKGVDGKLYAKYGPAVSVLCAPLVKFGAWAVTTSWCNPATVPFGLSHYVDGGLLRYVRRTAPTQAREHTIRFIASFFNSIVTAIGVVFFFQIVMTFVRSTVSAWAVTVLYAFGTPAWVYAGTFFSEPLVTTCVLLASYLLMRHDPRSVRPTRVPFWFDAALAGICLGMATSAHITAALFVPFLGVYFAYLCYRRRHEARPARTLSAFLLGCIVLLLLLGYYNYARFGSMFETGRTIVVDGRGTLRHGEIVAPWEGLYGLLVSPGKGLALYCPVAVLCALFWRSFHRKNPFLSVVLIAMMVTRLLFIATRSDWHGGFGLGPRHLVPIIPFLMLPAAAWLDDRLEKHRTKALLVWFACTFLCVAQQLAFCVGELFSFCHIMKWEYARTGVNVFKDDFLYLSWATSPLLHLLDYRTGPFLLQNTSWSNVAIWGTGVGVAGLLLLLLFWRLHLSLRKSLDH